MNQFNQMYQNTMNAPYLPQRNTYYPMNNNGITWVQGIEGAKAYQLLPNSNVLLMDSENDGRFYIKVSDNVGMSSLRVFQYTEIDQNAVKAQPSGIDLTEYVRKDELQSLILAMMPKQEVATNEQSVQSVKSASKSKPLISE